MGFQKLFITFNIPCRGYLLVLNQSNNQDSIHLSVEIWYFSVFEILDFRTFWMCVSDILCTAHV